MDGKTSEFFASANGDHWFLERGEAETTVIHRANPASGGAETRSSVDDFLKIAGDHPQGQALRGLLAKPGGMENGADAEPGNSPTVYPWTR
jgi:hypothetical protein